MDRRDQTQQYQKTNDEESEELLAKGFIMEEGRRFRLPYKIIKIVTFKNLDQKELVDIPHSARLQYRLLLFDAVIKAKVDYHKRFVRVIYNHPQADNLKEKMSRDEIVKFLSGEGVHVSTKAGDMEEADYDYYKELYQYAYFPPEIRESPPYGWTREEWRKEKQRKEKAKLKEENPGVLGKIFAKKTPKEDAGITLH
ncbi:MAG: hypothetical protein M1504_03720 [Candidatus Marsarchaeota archaeon]|nr:hypothetical protein [Candidatus Marsarchaeota archaeon]